MAHAIEPLALVLDALLRVDVLAFAMSEAVPDFALVGRAVRPAVTADTGDLVVPELALVQRAVGPIERAVLTVQQAVPHLALVRVTVAELARALAVINFANLYKFDHNQLLDSNIELSATGSEKVRKLQE